RHRASRWRRAGRGWYICGNPAQFDTPSETPSKPRGSPPVSQHPRLSLIAASLLIPLIPALVSAQDKEQDEDKPKTQTVKPGPFKVDVTFNGVFEATAATEIILRPEVWSSLKVEEVITEGKQVKMGDTLLKLETEDLDKAIRDQKFALRLSELSLQQANVEL